MEGVPTKILGQAPLRSRGIPGHDSEFLRQNFGRGVTLKA